MADKIIENSNKLTAFQKVNDWYSKHNFGTRLALFSFLGMYILAVGTSVDYTVFTSIDANVTQTLATTAKVASGTDIELVKIVGYFAFGAMALVTLGDNALTKIGDILVKIKGGKKDNSVN